jgi:uncharacterized protein (DUF58 family)
MARASSDDVATATLPTARGVGSLAFGVVLSGAGVAFAAPSMVYIGVALVAAVTVAWLWMTLSVHTFLMRFPFARRNVAPWPLSVGVPGRVTVNIASASAHAGVRHRAHRFTRALVSGLDIREQAASELTGGLGTKATVTRTPESLSLSYNLQPTARGRWPLGPALVHTTDPFGMFLADTSVGEAEYVPVWPAVVDLSATAGALMGQADKVVLGARTPSPDDAALRDYREGDDLRRVHWKSSARRGSMLVRSDERAGRRPATVLMDLPQDPVAVEWNISAAASIALSVLDSGHPVRLLGGGLTPDASQHDRDPSSAVARAQLMDHTVDLAPPVTPAAQERDILAAARAAAEAAPSGEVIIGIFEPLTKATLEALVPVAETGRAWALVRTSDNVAHKERAEDTLRSLRRAGWRAMPVTASDNLEDVWSTLLTTAGDLS